jgi:hypothetical protein
MSVMPASADPAAPAGSLPCPELAPWEWDEKIFWAFRCGLRRTLKRAPSAALEELVRKLEAWPRAGIPVFGLSFQTGLQNGVWEASVRYYQDLTALVRGGLLAPAQLFDATYDPEAYRLLDQFLRAEPGSGDQADALEAMAAYFSGEYPELAAALRILGIVSAALSAFSEWLANAADAKVRIAMAVSSSAAQVIGTEAATFVAHASSPARLGLELGRLIGNASVEVALIILGF